MNKFIQEVTEKSAIERKAMVDIESDIKLSLANLKDALRNIENLRTTDDVWELASRVYASVENCDKALNVVFKMERYELNDEVAGHADEWMRYPGRKDFLK